MSQFSESQIKAAFDNAKLHGYECPSRQVAINFVQWYFDHKTPVNSEYEAIVQGLSGMATNGIEQQQSFWADHGRKVA